MLPGSLEDKLDFFAESGDGADRSALKLLHCLSKAALTFRTGKEISCYIEISLERVVATIFATGV